MEMNEFRKMISRTRYEERTDGIYEIVEYFWWDMQDVTAPIKSEVRKIENRQNGTSY